MTNAPFGRHATDDGAAPPTTPRADPSSSEGVLPSLGSATEWLNSQPLTASALRGRIVLIQFWTYTCINWLRTLPYVRAWHQRYTDQGLTVVGVHTPEFEFERDVDNVRRAARDLSVEYPIAIDSDYAIWTAFENHYWPALYFIGANGHLRGHHFGEGDFERSERTLQGLLTEAGWATSATSWFRSMESASKPAPIGRACGPPRRTSGMRAPRTSPHPAVWWRTQRLHRPIAYRAQRVGAVG